MFCLYIATYLGSFGLRYLSSLQHSWLRRPARRTLCLGFVTCLFNNIDVLKWNWKSCASIFCWPDKQTNNEIDKLAMTLIKSGIVSLWQWFWRPSITYNKTFSQTFCGQKKKYANVVCVWNGMLKCNAWQYLYCNMSASHICFTRPKRPYGRQGLAG